MYEMRYYTATSSIFCQDSVANLRVLIWSLRESCDKSSYNLPSEDWIKINIDASKKQFTASISIGYIMMDNHITIIMKKED